MFILIFEGYVFKIIIYYIIHYFTDYHGTTGCFEIDKWQTKLGFKLTVITAAVFFPVKKMLLITT